MRVEDIDEIRRRSIEMAERGLSTKHIVAYFWSRTNDRHLNQANLGLEFDYRSERLEIRDTVNGRRSYVYTTEIDQMSRKFYHYQDPFFGD